jgi:hypothetical protein
MPEARGLRLWSLLIALVVGLSICPTKAHAQIVGEIEADVPFQFHIGNTKLPAGKYFIRQFDSANMATVMEITSATGTPSALFNVEPVDGKTSAANSELVFNKYGSSYFLASLYDAEDPSWRKVPESRYEKSVSRADAQTQEHLSARRRGEHGNGN